MKVFSLKSFALYGMTLNVMLNVKYLFVLACSSSNKIIEGSCVNLADIMASICVMECTRSLNVISTLYTLACNIQQGSSQIAKYQAHS